MTWTISNIFRPFRSSDTQSGYPIFKGGSATPPAYLGTLDLASNNNEILAHIGQPLVAQVGFMQAGAKLTVDIATPETFAVYRIQPPAVRWRAAGDYTILLVKVKAEAVNAGGATTFRINGATPIDTASSSYSAASAGAGVPVIQELSFYIEAATGIDVYAAEDILTGYSDAPIRLDLAVEVSVDATDVLIHSVHVFPAFHNEGFTNDADALNGYLCRPQDTEAWDGDRPINVQSVRELMIANNMAFVHSHRTLVSMCAWQDYATLNANRGIFRVSVAPVLQGAMPVMQFVYWPRPGVTNVAVNVNARLSTAGTATLGVKWEGGAETTATITNTSLDLTTWSIDNVLLPVPPGGGVKFLTLWSTPPASPNEGVWIAQASIYEVVDYHENMAFDGGL